MATHGHVDSCHVLIPRFLTFTPRHNCLLTKRLRHQGSLCCVVAYRNCRHQSSVIHCTITSEAVEKESGPEHARQYNHSDSDLQAILRASNQDSQEVSCCSSTVRSVSDGPRPVARYLEADAVWCPPSYYSFDLLSTAWNKGTCSVSLQKKEQKAKSKKL